MAYGQTGSYRLKPAMYEKIATQWREGGTGLQVPVGIIPQRAPSSINLVCFLCVVCVL